MKQQRVGDIKKNKKVIIPPKYGIAGNFTTCGIAPVGDKSGNYYIDKTGNFLDKSKEDVSKFKKMIKLVLLINVVK